MCAGSILTYRKTTMVLDSDEMEKRSGETLIVAESGSAAYSRQDKLFCWLEEKVQGRWTAKDDQSCIQSMIEGSTI